MKEINILRDVLEKYQVPKWTEKKVEFEKLEVISNIMKGKSYLGADITPDEYIYFAYFVEKYCDKDKSNVDETPTMQIRLSSIKENELDKIDDLFYIERVKDFIPTLRLKPAYPSSNM